MSISETVTRSAASGEAGRRERLGSPDIVQAGRAVRHPVRHAVGQQQWAKTKESATATNHITCSLLDSGGDIEKEIEVYCTLFNATALNAAAPRLIVDKIIPVAYFMGEWRSTWAFEGDKECVCTEPS